MTSEFSKIDSFQDNFPIIKLLKLFFISSLILLFSYSLFLRFWSHLLPFVFSCNFYPVSIIFHGFSKRYISSCFPLSFHTLQWSKFSMVFTLLRFLKFFIVFPNAAFSQVLHRLSKSYVSSNFCSNF